MRVLCLVGVLFVAGCDGGGPSAPSRQPVPPAGPIPPSSQPTVIIANCVEGPGTAPKDPVIDCDYAFRR
jgi:hypothetical protein